MDNIFSARVDEATIRRISRLAHKLHTTKKAVIEAAVRSYAEKSELERDSDVWGETHGAWERQESPGETVKRVRQAFRESMRRYPR
ncbi:MAG: ribbon-helix-helix protein, CopG family [Deltaproteobacteria bacterium]|nr:ribbon-helix-helix protein, CopG family [Deltaproteobacteria bacterium]